MVIALVFVLTGSAKAVSIYDIITNSCNQATEICYFYFDVAKKPVELYTIYTIYGWGMNKSVYYRYKPKYVVHSIALYPPDWLVASKTPVTLVFSDNAYSWSVDPEDIYIFWISLDDGQFYDITWNPTPPEQLKPVLTNWRQSLSTVGFDGYYLPPPPKAGHYVLVVGTKPPSSNDTLEQDWLHTEWDSVAFASVRFFPDFDNGWLYFQQTLQEVHSIEDLYDIIREIAKTFPVDGAKVARECNYDPTCEAERCNEECYYPIIPGEDTWTDPEVGYHCESLAIFLSEIILHKWKELGIPPDHMWFVRVVFPTGMPHMFLLVWKEDEDMFYALDYMPQGKIAKGHTLWEAVESAERSKEESPHSLGKLEDAQWSVAVNYLWWKELKDEACSVFYKPQAVYNGRYVYIKWIEPSEDPNHIPLTPEQMKQLTGEDLMKLTGRGQLVEKENF